mgnify:CR=1 FL=1
MRKKFLFTIAILTMLSAILMVPAMTQASATYPTAKAEASLTRLAYIYRSDLTAANDFKSFLEAKGYEVDLISITEAEIDYIEYSVIIIGSDTGEWDMLPDVISAICESGRPVLGIYRGGYYFFGKLGLDIGYPHGWWSSADGGQVVNPDHKIFKSPNDLSALMVDTELKIYALSVEMVAIHISPPAPPDVTLLILGETNHYRVVMQGKYVMWGFENPPSDMTEAGKALFHNIIEYLASNWPILSAWTSTPPTIDGTIDTATEWAAAASAEFTTTGGAKGIVYVMNDAENLYIGVKVEDPTLGMDTVGIDRVWIYFDNDHDEIGPEPGDDIIGWTGYASEGFKDGYSDGTYIWKRDIDDGGSSDGMAVATNDGTYNYFEIQHPLNSLDNAHDFSLSFGDIVGFAIRLTVDGFDKGFWPSSNPSLWADIIIKSPPPFDFDISASPPSALIVQGESTSFTINVYLVGGVATTVSLSISGLPSGASYTITPNSGAPPFTSTLTIDTSEGVTPGVYTITITGSGGGKTHSTTVKLKIKEKFDFSISASPPTSEVIQGKSVSFTITLNLVSGEPETVSLSLLGLPAGATYGFSPASGEPPFTSTLTIATTAAVTPGTYILTVRGVGPEKTHETTITLIVKKKKCIIATATYGSELAPEVQFLRNFRDDIVLSTFAGSQFMKVFNAWYYSFSPSVASLIANNLILKSIMKVILYPLIGILHLSALTYQVFSFNSELGVVMAGLVASALIGIVYFTPIALTILAVIRRIKKIEFRLNQLKFLAIPWITSLALILLAEILISPSLMMFATGAFVILTLTLSASIIAVKIGKFLL